MKMNITVSGFQDPDLEAGLDEVRHLLRTGFVTGSGHSRTSFFHCAITGEAVDHYRLEPARLLDEEPGRFTDWREVSEEAREGETIALIGQSGEELARVPASRESADPVTPSELALQTDGEAAAHTMAMCATITGHTVSDLQAGLEQVRGLFADGCFLTGASESPTGAFRYRVTGEAVSRFKLLRAGDDPAPRVFPSWETVFLHAGEGDTVVLIGESTEELKRLTLAGGAPDTDTHRR